MRYLLLALLLASCATPGPPTAQADPKLIDAVNVGLCMIRAANGDCVTPCATASAVVCPNLPSTATNQDVANAIPQCAISEGAAKAFAVLQAYKAVQCSTVPQPVVPAPAVRAPVVPPKP